MFHVLNFPNVLLASMFTLCLHDKNKGSIDFIGLSSLSFIVNDHTFICIHLISLIWIQGYLKYTVS